MAKHNFKRGIALLGGLLAGACQTTSAQTPATLEAADPQTLSTVKTVLARAMNTATVELGAGDLTQSSVIAVLPPRPTANEDRSLATPTLFDVVIKGSSCFVIRRDSGAEYALAGVRCRAVAR